MVVLEVMLTYGHSTDSVGDLRTLDERLMDCEATDDICARSSADEDGIAVDIGIWGVFVDRVLDLTSAQASVKQ